MKCFDCGALVHGDSNLCLACLLERQANKEAPHFTFPDDPEKEPRPGWGPFKFDRFLKKYKPFVDWHDKVTTINSMAQRAGITNAQIVEYTKIHLKLLSDEPRNGWEKLKAWGTGFFLSNYNRYFYEGPLGKIIIHGDDPLKDKEPWD